MLQNHARRLWCFVSKFFLYILGILWQIFWNDLKVEKKLWFEIHISHTKEQVLKFSNSNTCYSSGHLFHKINLNALDYVVKLLSFQVELRFIQVWTIMLSLCGFILIYNDIHTIWSLTACSFLTTKPWSLRTS